MFILFIKAEMLNKAVEYDIEKVNKSIRQPYIKK